MYTDLIFDLYGTLVDILTEETDEVWEKTALFFGYYGAHYTAAELKAAFEKEISARKASAGQSYECFPDIPFHEVMADLFRGKGIYEAADALGIQTIICKQVLVRAAGRIFLRNTDHLNRYRAILRTNFRNHST